MILSHDFEGTESSLRSHTGHLRNCMKFKEIQKSVKFFENGF
jgi:hypothetical protein